MTKQDWAEADWEDEQNSADAQFGDPSRCSLTRCQSSSTDHCGTAKRANKMVKESVKCEQQLTEYYGEEVWAGFDDQTKKRRSAMHLFGCGNHLRTIGYSNGMRAVAAYLRPLLADTVTEATEHGVQCVTGEIGMGLRSVLKFFGNTTKADFRSVGSEFKRWCTKHLEYSSMSFLNTGRCDLGQRQDGAAEQSWMLELRRSAMLAFILDYNWTQTDINFYAAIQLFLESVECESERVLYALIFHQVLEPHRTAVACGGKSRDARQPWINTTEDMQKKGLPSQLQTLGPLECYELMLELMGFLKRVAEDPSLLLRDLDYTHIFDTELYQHWWMYNYIIHSRGKGKTAAGSKTESSYWEATREHLLEYAKQYINTPLFKNIARLFCESFCSSVRPPLSATGNNAHDYGWFDKLEEVGNTDVESFRAISKWLLPYSPNESYFGQVSASHNINVRIYVCIHMALKHTMLPALSMTTT